MHAFADRLRAASHDVHAIDFFDGETFEDLEAGIAKRDALGMPALIARAQAAVDGMPPDTVFAGFSMGAAAAEFIAARRPGARGALLMSGAIGPAWLEVERWPEGVPVQVHYTEEDPEVDTTEIEALGDAVRASGASFEAFTYPGSGHLFADPDLPEYDRESAELMTERALEFLART